MSALIVIPARYGSSRFPGKPLVKIAGIPLLQRVWNIARAVASASEVVIATEDQRIEDAANGFGAHVIRTSPECRNGSERVHETVKTLGKPFDIIVNLQGDAVLTPPQVVQNLIEAMQKRPEIQIGTPAVRISPVAYEMARTRTTGAPGGTYVACGLNGQALYFSRFPIPYVRPDSNVEGDFPVFKHIGLYGFRPTSLDRYVTLAPTPLEKLEQLEQLRALEHGIPIHVIEVTLNGRTLCSVDRPEDAQEAERIIAREGELVNL